MVVDFHIHTVYYQTKTATYMDFIQHQWGGIFDELVDSYSTPENYIQLMDECGIDYAVILAELSPTTTGIVDNEYVYNFCSLHPRLLPFACINPYISENPAHQLERLVVDKGFRGLKLYPTYQYFYPNDAMLYPLYAKAQELGIPVMFHTGSSVFAGSKLKYGDPILLDDVAVDFPKLTLIMCHGGRPIWYDKAFWIARLHPNCYIDISGLPPGKLLTYFPELERIGDKVVYGSDFPGVPTIRENLEAVRKLPFAEEVMRKILGENAARLLKLP